MTEDQKRYMNAVSEMQRIKGRIILLLIAAAVFAVLTVLVLILRPGTNILPLTVTWFGFALVMALVETTTLNSQSKNSRTTGRRNEYGKGKNGGKVNFYLLFTDNTKPNLSFL